MAFGETTDVAFEKSIAEILMRVRNAGADNVGQMEGSAMFTLGFELGGRAIRFRLPFPTQAEVSKAKGPRQDATKVADQMRRQKGRALLLVVKAKLESIESGIETVEEAFLANVVMPGGATVYEQLKEPIQIAYADKARSPLMLTSR